MKLGIKNLIFLFSLLSISTVCTPALNSEENACNYSNTKEYENCYSIRGKRGSYIRHPILIGDTYSYFMWFTNPKNCQGRVSQYCRIHLYSSNNEQIEIQYGSSLGFNSILPFKPKGSYVILGKNIKEWNKVTGDSDRYRLEYYNDYGELKRLEIVRIKHRSISGDVISRLFESVSNLNSGEKQSSSAILNRLLQEKEKELIRIKHFITFPTERQSSCSKLDTRKYPDLVAKYKNTNYKISLLRKKLNLRPIRPICI